MEAILHKLIPINNKTRESLLNSAIGTDFLEIFDNQKIIPFFQPIVEVKTREIYGFEALSRGPKNSNLFSPINLFNIAIEHGCLFELDLLARKLAIQEYANRKHEHNDKAKLFLNISVASLLVDNHESGSTLNILDMFDIKPSQVVIEITELQPVKDINSFILAINHYQKMGFKVAIDDLGSGYNGLKLWTDVKPDFVKIDKHFIDGIDIDANKYRFMETVMTLAKSLGTKIIAEGVETEKQLKVLEELRVDFVQGFLLKRPSPSACLNLDYEWQKPSFSPLIPKETVSSLANGNTVFSIENKVGEVAEFFLSNIGEEYLPVVDKKKVVGMVWRKEVMNILASKYGRDLYFRKNIINIIDEDSLIFEYDTTLVEASRIITEQDNMDKTAFIVIKQGKYLGCGSFMSLLKVITDLKVKDARYSNPLSGLPGNVPIQNTVQDYLNKEINFTLIYIDVDNFKPYNDNYSFEEGDKVINLIADILLEVTDDFVGHIGGDDFVIISQKKDSIETCKKILAKFQEKIINFYSPKDVEQKGIYAKNRQSEVVFYPIMSLSLGVLMVHPNQYSHTQELSSAATSAKKGAKDLGGNTFFVVDS